MSTDKTGGPAFPQDAAPSWSDLKPTHPGMSLLDYFAGVALTALLQSRRDLAYSTITEQAYEYAAAMIETKQKMERVGGQ